jgi:hypothetical protein
MNSALSMLPDLRLIVAMASFQEMSAGQISMYLEVLADRCTGVLYSDNTEGHPDNDELRVTPLSSLLARDWDLHPPRSAYEELQDGDLPWFHRAYVAVPKSGRGTLPPTGSIRFIGGNYKKGRKYRYGFATESIEHIE